MGKNIRDFKISDPCPEKCCHKPKAKRSSLRFLDGIRTMTFPEHVYAVCECCGQSFEYILGEKGKLTEVKNEE